LLNQEICREDGKAERIYLEMPFIYHLPALPAFLDRFCSPSAGCVCLHSHCEYIYVGAKIFSYAALGINMRKMNKFGILVLPVIFFLIPGCDNNNRTKNNITRDSITTAVGSTQLDSAISTYTGNKSDSVIADKNAQPFLPGRHLKSDDFIKQYPADQKDELRRHIERLRKEWQNVPNPIIATYQGNDFGDYHHVLFKDANGVVYDFGQAKNSYGQYKLHELSGQYDDNPEFSGKKFKVYLDWVLSDFFCCDGEYGKAKAFLPSITRLELLKN